MGRQICGFVALFHTRFKAWIWLLSVFFFIVCYENKKRRQLLSKASEKRAY